VEQVLDLVQQKDLDPQVRRERVRAVIERNFDFVSMSQSVLATHWKKAGPEEQESFVSFFSDHLENTYLKAIESYSGQRVVYGRERIRGDRASVDTHIETRKARIPVTYKLRLNDDAWRGYDVVIENQSLARYYREIFDAIVSTEGMDGLMSDLDLRVSRQQAISGTAPPYAGN
jgi:phospholipid transport system substrate-binding protein